jgi:acyl carrier protein
MATFGGKCKMSTISKVKDFVVENFLFGEGDSLREDTSFLEEGIIDSTGILELVMFIEETYSIKVEDDELIPENMDNLQNIAQYLERKLAESPAAEA